MHPPGKHQEIRHRFLLDPCVPVASLADDADADVLEETGNIRVIGKDRPDGRSRFGDFKARLDLIHAFGGFAHRYIRISAWLPGRRGGDETHRRHRPHPQEGPPHIAPTTTSKLTRTFGSVFSMPSIAFGGVTS